MKIVGFVWLPEIVDKLNYKHNVQVEEVEQILENRPTFCFAQRSNHEGEDAYAAFGQTEAGRYIVVIFIYKQNREVLILSARDMAVKEKKWYGRK